MPESSTPTSIKPGKIDIAFSPAHGEEIIVFRDAVSPALEAAFGKLHAAKKAMTKILMPDAIVTDEIDMHRALARSEAAATSVSPIDTIMRNMNENLKGNQALQDEFSCLLKSGEEGMAEMLAHRKFGPQLLKFAATSPSESIRDAAQEIVMATKEYGAHMLELRKAQTDSLHALPIEKRTEFAEAIKNFKRQTHEIERMVKPTLLNSQFAISRELGLEAAFEHNLTFDALKTRPMETSIKMLGGSVGLGAIIDAATRKQSQDTDGLPEMRSKMTRLNEAVLGAALMAGTALHGRR